MLIFSALTGLFAIGAYPVALELAVEVTYPVEASISAMFIYLSNQVQAVALMFLVPALARPTAPSEGEQCSAAGHEIILLDYTCECLYIIFSNTLGYKLYLTCSFHNRAQKSSSNV